MNIEKINTDLKKVLSPFRYEHSIKVAEEAKKLAKHYHINEKNAYLAGLIHDIAKDLTEKECKQWIEEYKLPEKLLDKKYKNIKHADIGAIIAKEKYHLEDDICNSIKYHTIGNKRMNLLAKIVYIADKIGRDNIPEALKNVKEIAYQDIDKALLYCLEKQKIRLEEKGIKMHKDTEELLEKLQKT